MRSMTLSSEGATVSPVNVFAQRYANPVPPDQRGSSSAADRV